MRINKHDTNGTKPLLGKGELGYDDYPAGGDVGRVFVGTGTENIGLAKKVEVVAVDSKSDTHIGRTDNPHSVTKAQIGLDNVDNTADAGKNVLSASKLTTARNIALTGDVTGNVTFDGSAGVSIATTIAANSVALGADTTGNYVAGNTAGTGITVTGTAGEGWSPTISIDSTVATLSGTQTLTNKTLQDNTTFIIDGIDATKKVQFDVAGVATATTRTMTIPNVNGTIITTGDTGTITSTMISDGTIVNTDINASAGIVDTKLATIATAGKVSNSATTATNLNTANAIVSRDASGNFSAGTITANISGNSSTATTLATPRNITLGGDASGTASFNGSADASITVVVADNSHLHTIANVTGLQTTLDSKVDDSEKGSANGVATLDANGKVILTQIPDSVLGQLEYQGVWDFTTLPTATQKGQYWIASVSGNGYVVGDWAVWSGLSFDKVDNTDAVASVAGRTGNVVLTKSDVSLNLVDNTADSSKNVLSATKLTTARTLTIGSTGKTFDGTANTTWTVSEIGAQPVDADLTAIAGLADTTGILKKTAANTWVLDTNAYVTSSGVTTVTGTAPIVSSGGATPALSITAATTSAAGSMSAADKTKLDGIASGAQVNVPTDLSLGTATSTTIPLNSSTGTDVTLPAVTTATAGLMGSADKNKLDGIAAGANNYVLPTASSTVIGGVKVSATTQTVAANAVSATASRTYAVQLDASNNSLINVPWTDTVYTHPTTDGNLHVPATGTTNNGKVLTAGSTAGSLSWVTPVPGVTNHTLLTNIGTNTHSQIDTALTRLANTSGTNTGDQTITLTGDVTGSGTGSFATTLANSGVTAGTYSKVTVDGKGRVTAGLTLVATDIPVLDASKITTGTLPVTRGGTGVTTSTGTGNVVLSTSPTLVTPNIGVATGTSFNSITGLSAVVGTANGTAAVGTSTAVARADHVHPNDTTKVTKVTSTDNAIVRFNGVTGDVQNSAITIDDAGNIGSGTQSFNGFGGGGFKNYIINGNFDVWQRGTSQTTSGYGSDDRWNNEHVGSTKTHSVVACTDTERALFNASYFSRTVVTHIASGAVAKFQNIEDITKLAGKTVTLSFWAKADSNKNISVSFAQVFGIGGSPSAVIANIGAGLIALTSTWQKFTKTVTIPSIVGKTIGDNTNSSYTHVRFTFDDLTLNQSGTFDIAQVQLEEGSVATPFENRPYGLELSLCQRYYEVCVNQSVASTGYILANGCTNYKVLKRVTPSILISGFYDNAPNVVSEYNTGSVFVASRAAGGSTVNSLYFCMVQVNGTATVGNDIRYKLSIDAEL